MSNRKVFLRSWALLLVAALAVPPAFCEDEKNVDYPNASAPPMNGEPGVVGGASRAVMGRVFGVKGEGGNIDYHVVELSKVSPFNSAFRSALIPGWGQHFNRQPAKGTLFFFAFAASTFGAFYMHNKSNQTYNDYQDLGVKDGALYDDYQNQQTASVLLGTAALFLWGISIFDAYRNAYNPLYSRDVRVDLAYNSDETTVRLSKKF